MTDNEKLAELLFPNITKTPEDYEKYIPREVSPMEQEFQDLLPARQAFFILADFLPQ